MCPPSEIPGYATNYTRTNLFLFRDISAISVALLRVILHSIFVYTLQTRNMKNPTYITKLVECTEPYSCTNYFSLHLIQDIRDVTTICNNTFEEAILIVHILIDHLLTVQPDTRMSVYIYVAVSWRYLCVQTNIFNTQQHLY